MNQPSEESVGASEQPVETPEEMAARLETTKQEVLEEQRNGFRCNIARKVGVASEKPRRKAGRPKRIAATNDDHVVTVRNLRKRSDHPAPDEPENEGDYHGLADLLRKVLLTRSEDSDDLEVLPQTSDAAPAFQSAEEELSAPDSLFDGMNPAVDYGYEDVVDSPNAVPPPAAEIVREGEELVGYIDDFSATMQSLGINLTSPTSARPGSEDRVQVLTARYAAGLPLWHDEDSDGENAHSPEENEADALDHVGEPTDDELNDDEED